MKKILTFTKIKTGTKNFIFGKKIKSHSSHFRKSLKKDFFEKRNFSIQASTIKQKLLTEPGNIAKKKIVCYELENFTKNYLQKEKLQTKDSRILCTISSGQDSILTFFLLLHTKKIECLEVLYCQHFWQTKNFFSARLLFKISYLVKVPYTISLKQRVSFTENDSRDWRKKTFCRFSKMENILTTITGHTETDSLEKNVNNLLRGTSPRGVSKSLFLNSKKTVTHFFSTINQNSCLLTKKTDQNVFKRNRLDQQWLILKTKFDFSNRSQKVLFGKINFFSELEIAPKKRIGNLRKIQLTSKLRKNGFDTINFGNFVSKNEDFYGQKKFYFLKTKTSCSFLLSSKFYKLPINLINPLENINRFNVSSLVNLYKFPILSDITNFSSNFSRNKIRHQLFPFLRSLVHTNFESSLTKFFKMLSKQTKNLETDFEEVNFMYRCLKWRRLKSVPSFSKASVKILRNKICKKDIRFLIQKMFFNYKNISLNYSQILGLDQYFQI